MKGQTILITGATSGIGRHAALAFAARGHRVIASGRNKAALDTLHAQSPQIDVLTLDVTDIASIADAVVEVDRLTDGRGVDVLVNNAGYGLAGPLVEITDPRLRDQFEVNVFGLMNVTRAFLPKMMGRGSGRILNVSSVSGRFSVPFFGAYHASKWAVETMSDSLRMELKPFGVSVVLIEPGTIRTEFTERTMHASTAVESDDSPYAPAYARAHALADKLMSFAVGPEVISNVMIRAVEADKPRARYVAPFYARVEVMLMRALPTWLTDAVLSRMAGLSAVRPRTHESAEHARTRASL